MVKFYPTIALLQADLQNGSVTCVQIVQHYLNAIKKHESLNVFLEVFADEALQKALATDKKIASGTSLGKLFGVVLGIKDVLCYKDHAVTAASKILDGFVSLFSSTAIERLLAEDAIIIGRINCDEFAMGSTNENSSYGVVHNAYDTNKVPGGSSGGSAVAVQSKLCQAALGTDTGGSVRQPASFCNVVGTKPSYGRISRHGLLAYASSFDQIGTLTHSPTDAALLLEIMAGSDNFDSTVSAKPVPTYSEQLQFEGKAKIAYFSEALNHKGLDPEIRQQLQQYLQNLVNEGHEVSAVPFPYLQHMVPAYYILTSAEASSNLSRYDGIHYGYRSSHSDDELQSTYKYSRSEGFGKEVKRRIMLGTFVLSAGYYDAYYGKAQKVRRLIYESTQQILSQYDFIITPTTPTTAFNLGDKAYQDPVAMYLGDIFTVQANLAGIPAISLPLFTHSNGLPFGLQIMAGKFEETKLLAFAQKLITANS
jgi:aspartyl-tRNA(Asn)/glutamyl-tRNA(Gln) amidotransferase subunit A